MLNALALPLRTELRLELSNGAQHMEQEPAGRITGVEVLIQHLQMDAFALQVLRDLAEVER